MTKDSGGNLTDYFDWVESTIGSANVVLNDLREAFEKLGLETSLGEARLVVRCYQLEYLLRLEIEHDRQALLKAYKRDWSNLDDEMPPTIQLAISIPLDSAKTPKPLAVVESISADIRGSHIVPDLGNFDFIED